MEILDLYENRTNLDEVADAAVEAFQKGKTVVYPTDTVYGFGCDAENVSAINRINIIKLRDAGKPMSVIMRDFEMISHYAHFSKEKEMIVQRLLPGKVTVILPLKGSRRLPKEVTGDTGTIGIRIPNHDLNMAVAQKFDRPYVSTSVNLSGEPPEVWGMDIIKKYEKAALKPDLIIDAGKLSDQPQASTVIDLSGNKPRILRTGAVNPLELLKLLSGFNE